jgi:hypothetical protein
MLYPDALKDNNSEYKHSAALGCQLISVTAELLVTHSCPAAAVM